MLSSITPSKIYIILWMMDHFVDTYSLGGGDVIVTVHHVV